VLCKHSLQKLTSALKYKESQYDKEKAVSSRSSIKYPPDILAHISKMRGKDSKMTINEALFILARRGMANENIEALSEFQDAMLSMENQLKSIKSELEKPTNYGMFITKIYGILRRYIHETDKDVLPLCDKTADELYDKTQG
tara:strand:+ start:82 stop:507 length:426 start_codon:yes stop_codon:yes gene_type:complete